MRLLPVLVPAGLLAAGLLVPAAASAAPAAATAVPPVAWSLPMAGVHRSSPTVGALSVGKVVLQADMAGWLTATRADGSLAWRSPVDPRPGARTAVESSPAVGDLTGDGVREVVVGAGSGEFTAQDGGVVAYRGDGTVLWRWRSPDRSGPAGPADGVGDGVYSSPAIGDVNGDGRPDVVFGGWDHSVWALDGPTGQVVAGFPFDNADTVWSSPALTDTDGDGVLDVLVGGDASSCACSAGSYNGGVLRALKATGGRVVQRYRVDVPDIVASSPAIGDLEGNGRLAAVFAVGNYWRPADTRRVFAVHVDDGSPVPGWPQRTDASGFGSVALGDVVPGDGGRVEVVVGDTAGTVYAWRGNGALAWRSHPGADGSSMYGGPSIGDVDGDGGQDVAVGYGFGGALLLEGRTGRTLAHVDGGTGASEVTPLFADLGGRKLVVAGWDPRVGGFATGRLTAFRLPSSKAVDAWPMFRRDALHRGGGVVGAPVVQGAIGEKYAALGGAAGVLGKPTSGELTTPHRDGRYTTFVHGRIYWTASTGAHEVHGLIFDAWGRTGWETGPLGYPTTDETRLPTMPGAFNAFSGGSVYWSPSTGAHPVVGVLRDAYRASGWETGCLGLPVDDERAGKVGGLATRTLAFQHGSITWTAGKGARVSCG